MNERIQELYKQASKQDYFPQDGEEVYMSAEDLKKFAELLVQECADYIDAFNRENMVEEGIGGAELKQHFGVEE